VDSEEKSGYPGWHPEVRYSYSHYQFDGGNSWGPVSSDSPSQESI